MTSISVVQKHNYPANVNLLAIKSCFYLYAEQSEVAITGEASPKASRFGITKT